GSNEIKKMWVRKADSFIAFCLDNLQEANPESMDKAQLRKSYHHYCKGHKLIPKSDIVIKNTLQQIYGASEERKVIALNGGEQEAIWVGVQWK
ncbi:hypothetical protein LCGC14_1241420, partial [marine sediment metagenome]